MRVWITVDHVDGSRSKARGPFYVDEIDTTAIRLRLSEAGVSSITITRADLLRQVRQNQEGKA